MLYHKNKTALFKQKSDHLDPALRITQTRNRVIHRRSVELRSAMGRLKGGGTVELQIELSLKQLISRKTERYF